MGGGQPGRRRDEPGAQSATSPQADQDRINRLRLIGLGLQLGGTIVGSLILFMLGGIWLDRRLGTSPLFVLVGVVLAFVAIGYNLYELATIKTTPQRTRLTTRPGPAADDPWDDKDEDDDWPVRRGTGGKGKEG